MRRRRTHEGRSCTAEEMGSFLDKAIVLYSIVLYSIVLYSIVLYCIFGRSYCIVLHQFCTEAYGVGCSMG
jgi:hypothetical protein